MGTDLFMTICHPDDLAMIYEASQKIGTVDDDQVIETEYRVKDAQGEWHWLASRDLVFSRTEDGRVWQTLVTSQDISDRKQAELLLISSKERAEQAELKLQKTQVILERINQRLLKLIDTDTLTKIANRRCFNIRFRQEWKRLFREQKTLSLILFDVDYFKNYNDCYGHPQGDRCLIKVAQTAKQAVKRSADLVARIGGEEFAVILPDTDLKGAKVAAENIRLAIESLEIPHQNSQVKDKVTISLGIMSLIPTTGQSPTTLINQADQALLEAKKRGKNQSVIFCEIFGYNENR